MSCFRRRYKLCSTKALSNSLTFFLLSIRLFFISSYNSETHICLFSPRLINHTKSRWQKVLSTSILNHCSRKFKSWVCTRATQPIVLGGRGGWSVLDTPWFNGGGLMWLCSEYVAMRHGAPEGIYWYQDSHHKTLRLRASFSNETRAKEFT